MSEIVVSPKIKNINAGAAFAKDIINNPPQTPLEAIKVFSSAINFDGVLTSAVGAIFPLALPVLPMLSGIFDLFSGGGPSIGQVTLDAIGKVSEQIADGLAAVAKQTEQIAEAQASRTISTVISGVDQIAKQQSAAEILENANAVDVLNELEAKKLLSYTEFTDKVTAARSAFVADVGGALQAAQQKANAEYRMIQSQVAQVAGSVFNDIQKTIDSAAADANEIYEIEKQIIEIKTVIETGQLAAIAKTLVMRYLGIK